MKTSFYVFSLGCFGKLDHIKMSEIQLDMKSGSILFLIWLKIDPGCLLFFHMSIF